MPARTPAALALVATLVFVSALRAADEATPSSPAPQTITTFHTLLATGKIDDARAALALYPSLANLPLPNFDETQQVAPLHTAVRSNQLESVKLLLEKGAHTEPKCDGHTPLFSAAIAGRDGMIALLLKHGADINGGTNASDLADITPIRAAQLYGKTATAQLLLEKGARIDFFSAAGLGWTTFLADRLEENPALATFPDNWGSQAAWIAVNANQVRAVELLVKAGATITGRHGNEGFTALHIAAERGYTDLAAWLVKNGLDVHTRDHLGRTPLDYARNHGQHMMAEWLKTHGGT